MERRHGRGFNAVAKGVVGPMAAWRIAEGDWTRIWQAVVVDLFSGCSARRHWRRRRSHRRHDRVQCLGGVCCGFLSRTRSAHLEHEQAKAELKGLMPEDAKEATGHGVRAKRSKSGAVSIDLLSVGGLAMHRSSESIATLAAALAKAQSELVNPEKSLVATIVRDTVAALNRASAMPRCRAGSISCARPLASTRSRPCRHLAIAARATTCTMAVHTSHGRSWSNYGCSPVPQS